MLIPFEEMSPKARVWVYGADRKMSSEECQLLEDSLIAFCDQWNVHGKPLQSSYTILSSQFVVLAADEQLFGASGCSIDSSIHVLKSVQQSISVDFFNRDLIPFLIDGETTLINRKDLKSSLEKDVWGEDTKMINTMAETVEDIRHRWTIPSGNSWLRTYLAKRTVSR